MKTVNIIKKSFKVIGETEKMSKICELIKKVLGEQSPNFDEVDELLKNHNENEKNILVATALALVQTSFIVDQIKNMDELFETIAEEIEEDEKKWN